MEQPEKGLLQVGRRECPRLRLSVPAKLCTLHGHQNATLEDLSETGAQITLTEELRFSSGFLQWLSYEVFADVVWQEGRSWGLALDRRLPEDWLLETRRKAPGLKDKEGLLRRMAENWTKGSPDW